MKRIAVLSLALILLITLLFTNHSEPKTVNNKITPNIVKFTPIYGQVVRHGLRDKKQIALTFDADMTPGMVKNLETKKTKTYYNEEIINILKNKQTPATLFLTGLWLKTYPNIAKNLSLDPLFEIGIHSYSHYSFTGNCYNLPVIIEKNKDQDFKMAGDLFQKTLGFVPALYRFPGGCYGKSDLVLANKYNLTVVHWDIDGRDAFNNSVPVIMNNIKKNAQNGSIVVFHLNGNRNAPKTAEALPQVIDYLKSRGFQFVKVGELLQGLNGKYTD